MVIPTNTDFGQLGLPDFQVGHYSSGQSVYKQTPLTIVGILDGSIESSHHLKFEPEEIYRLQVDMTTGGNEILPTSLELLARPQNGIGTAQLLEQHLSNNTTHLLTLEALRAAEIVCKKSKGDIQINIYLQDIVHPEVIKALENFTYPGQLVLEIVENGQQYNPNNDPLGRVGYHCMTMAYLEKLGIRFSIDDFSNDHRAVQAGNASRQIFYDLQNSISGGANIYQVKFDGLSMIRPLFILTGNAREAYKNLLRDKIESLKKFGVEDIIAEFVESFDEAQELFELGFTGVQGKYLKKRAIH